MTAINSCPHCGHATAPGITDSEEFYGDYWDAGNARYFAVMCNASEPGGPGGCGASGRFCETEEKAIEAWNRRAAPSQPEGADQRPFGWARIQRDPGGPWAPPENRVDMVDGDDEPEGDGWFPLYRHLSQSAGAAAPDEGEGWQPIETAPLGATMFVVRAFEVLYGSTDHVYTSDPYCVWQAKKGLFSRWPHPFAPTHWMPLPSAPKGEAATPASPTKEAP